ncbi:MAG: anthranilate synthase component I family protein [Alphaproteobacteria bacterium]
MLNAITNQEEFLSNYSIKHDALLYRQLSIDTLTPVAAMIKLQSWSRHMFLLESVEQGKSRSRYSFLGWQAILLWQMQNGKAFHRYGDDGVWQEKSHDPLSDLNQILNQHIIKFPDGLPAAASGFFGFLSYEAVRLIEKIPSHRHDAHGLPDGRYFLPKQILIFDNVMDKAWLVVRCQYEKNLSASSALEQTSTMMDKTFMMLQQPLPASSPATENMPQQPQFLTSETEFIAAVNKTIDYIKAGDIFQAVISQVFQYDNFHASPLAFYRALRATNPAPYMFFFRWDDFAFVGASPETLVKVDNKKVSVYPIAGTRARGKTDAEDKKLEEELKHDPKERAEHLMLLDLGRNDVGKVAELGSVKVVQEFQVERYSFVMHLVSEVVGQLAKDKSSLAALLAGMPAGTVSGAPKIRAMEIIAELEKTQRGLYAGAVGYFSSKMVGQMSDIDDKDFVNQADSDHCIALRCALLKDDKVVIQTGAGVVYDSIPKNEQQECLHKAQALFKAFDRTYEFSGN